SKASISSIPAIELQGISLYDNEGNQIVRSSTGNLAAPIVIEPWQMDTLLVKCPVTNEQDINGELIFEGDFTSASTIFKANVVSSPEFSWTAVDQNINMLNGDEYEYAFSISNSGTTALDYRLMPAVKSNLPEGVYPGEIKEIAKLGEEDVYAIDSLVLDRKEIPDSYHSPGTMMLYSNHFTAPEGGMLITHVRVNLNLKNPDKLLGLHIAVNGDLPERGRLWSRNVDESITDLTPATFAYEQKYKAPEAIDNEWIIMPLTQPVQIQDGEDFWVTIDYPGTDLARSGHSLGYDVAINESTLDSTIYGIERDYFDFGISWSHNDMGKVWKIRPLTAIGDDGQWLMAEPVNGTVAGGESVEIATKVIGDFAKKGQHEGQLIVVTNDVDNKTSSIRYDVNVNGYPELIFKPNSYKDTLRMVETETHILNYVFEDPEGDAITFNMNSVDNDSIKVMTESTTSNGAKVKVITNYDSDGYYEIPVSLTDAAGNVLGDTICFEVKDLNRTPYFNPIYKNIKLNLADPEPMVIDINDLFIDPDGDDLYLQAGNINQQVLDMALGYDYITLHPKAEGLGFLVFAADDGKENGYKFDYCNVIVNNEPEAVPNDLSGFEGNEQLMEQLEQGMVISPNLVHDEASNVLFRLDEDANVRIEVYNMKGQYMNAYLNSRHAEGMNQEQVDFSTLTPGLYLCRFVVNNEVKNTVKIIVK
ncbi:MAG: T9SS type A sorting domain-containing protein, partial [Bacteroidales bacterium]|nr:T9SS type A sorting domain-containing protein [Bacteroidales bacterium]